MTDEPTLPTTSGSLKDQLDIDLTMILVTHDVAVRARDQESARRNVAAAPDGPFVMLDLSDIYATTRANLRAIIDGHRVAPTDDDYEYGYAISTQAHIEVCHPDLVKPDVAQKLGILTFRRIRPGQWERLP